MTIGIPVTTYGFAYLANSNPEARAICDSTGQCLLRSELNRLVNQIAHGLLAQGLRPGHVVAILSSNCVEFVATYLAATDIGLYVVPINWHLSAPEVSYILEDSGSTVLFAHERLAALVRRVLDAPRAVGVVSRIAFGHIEGFKPLSDLVCSQPEHRVSDPVRGRVLMYTSATTGLPKAIDLSLSDAEATLARTVAFHVSCGIAIGNGNVHLCASMLYHAAPLEWVAIALHMGHTVVLMDQWDPERLLRLINDHRVTTTFMVPTMFVRLLKLQAEVRARYDVSSLRLVSHSAAPCSLETKKQMMDWWGPVLWECYGAAEGQGTVVGPAEWLQRPGTVGRAMPGSKLRILDDAGNEVPSGTAGLIYFSRFTGDEFGYRGDPAKTLSAYRGDVFTVGDIGYMDEDGYLYICDRKVDMVITGGMNIYSTEVEQVLVQHPSVLDCAVFGVPDELMGEAVRAVVQLSPGVIADTDMTANIMSFLRQRLSLGKLPRKIDYLEELPRDPNGKLYKRLLRDPYWVGHARPI